MVVVCFNLLHFASHLAPDVHFLMRQQRLGCIPADSGGMRIFSTNSGSPLVEILPRRRKDAHFSQMLLGRAGE